MGSAAFGKVTTLLLFKWKAEAVKLGKYVFHTWKLTLDQHVKSVSKMSDRRIILVIPSYVNINNDGTEILGRY
jgi:hypothetical protein